MSPGVCRWSAAYIILKTNHFLKRLEVTLKNEILERVL